MPIPDPNKINGTYGRLRQWFIEAIVIAFTFMALGQFALKTSVAEAAKDIAANTKVNAELRADTDAVVKDIGVIKTDVAVIRTTVEFLREQNMNE